MRPVYAALASLTMSVHFLFLVYLTLGGFLTWRWRRALWPHLAVVAWGVVSITVGVTCPLTVLEDWARRRAGEPGLAGGFIDHYLTGVIYPRRYTVVVQALVAACVAASWLGLYVRRRRQASDSFKTGAGPGL
jgi:hypothetical protein